MNTVNHAVETLATINAPRNDYRAEQVVTDDKGNFCAILAFAHKSDSGADVRVYWNGRAIEETYDEVFFVKIIDGEVYFVAKIGGETYAYRGPNRAMELPKSVRVDNIFVIDDKITVFTYNGTVLDNMAQKCAVYVEGCRGERANYWQFRTCEVYELNGDVYFIAAATDGGEQCLWRNFEPATEGYDEVHWLESADGRLFFSARTEDTCHLVVDGQIRHSHEGAAGLYFPWSGRGHNNGHLLYFVTWKTPRPRRELYHDGRLVPLPAEANSWAGAMLCSDGRIAAYCTHTVSRFIGDRSTAYQLYIDGKPIGHLLTDMWRMWEGHDGSIWASGTRPRGRVYRQSEPTGFNPGKNWSGDHHGVVVTQSHELGRTGEGVWITVGRERLWFVAVSKITFNGPVMTFVAVSRKRGTFERHTFTVVDTASPSTP